VQLHVYLKKWTLKFKPLYLRNYPSYFNKIRKISCVKTRIKSLNVWLKSILPWLKYSIFHRGLFFIGAPCILMLTAANLTTLASRREEISKKILYITEPISCLHHLLPKPRGPSIISRLRTYQKYPRVYTRTKLWSPPPRSFLTGSLRILLSQTQSN